MVYCYACEEDHDDEDFGPECDDGEGPPERDYDDDDYLIDGVGFADPGGRSALRAATADNPRDQPCPSCGAQDVLTRLDVERGYQCNRCADRDEGGYGY